MSARHIDPYRRCLLVSEWPRSDQLLWRQITAAVSPLDENRSTASGWSPATRHKNRRGYGRWLNFLINSEANIDAAPADRVTAETVGIYVTSLIVQPVAPYTLNARVAELLAVMLAAAPARDWSWLKRKVNRLAWMAKDAHVVKAPPLLATQTASSATKALNQLRGKDVLRIHDAIAYRNWLMVLFLTLIPLRLKNFTTLCIGKDVRKRADVWQVDIPSCEIKTKRALRAPVPDILSKHLEFYWHNVRPLISRGRRSDRLWLNWVGRAMSDHAIYLTLTKFTRKTLGHHINPHAFRHLTATSISILKPEEVDTARALLGHSSITTTMNHYIAANSLIAGRRHAEVINRLRRQLPPRRS